MKKGWLIMSLVGIVSLLAACSPDQKGDCAKASSLESLKSTDPEFFENYSSFANEEISSLIPKGNAVDVPNERDRALSKLAVMMGSQSLDLFKAELPNILNKSLSPIEVKELVYQGVPYLGMGRVLPFLNATNELFEKQGIKLPLEQQGTTNKDTRLLAGAKAQVDIFGERMIDFYKSGTDENRHINQVLASNCFGDYYTRKGLDLKDRELLTLCYLYAQGGADPQLISHADGNLKMGRSKQYLINVVSLCIPYIGYPRTLNAIRGINEAAQKLALQNAAKDNTAKDSTK